MIKEVFKMNLIGMWLLWRILNLKEKSKTIFLIIIKLLNN